MTACGLVFLLTAAAVTAACAPATAIHPQVVSPAASISAAIRGAEQVILNNPECLAAFEEVVSTDLTFSSVEEVLTAPTYRLWSVEMVKPELVAYTLKDERIICIRLGIAGSPNHERLVRLVVHELAHMAGAEDARRVESTCLGGPSISGTP